MRNRFNLTSAFFGAVALVMAASLFLSLWTLSNEQEVLKHRFRENIVWHATQSEIEANAFLRYVIRYSHGDLRVALQDVVDKFDILWSRVDIISRGAVGENYKKLKGAVAALDGARQILAELEPLILELSRDDAVAEKLITERMETLIGLFHLPLMSAHNQVQSSGEQHRRRTLEAYANAFVLLFGAMASGGILVLLIFLKQRALNELSANLELRVDQRTRELSEKVSEVEQARMALSDQNSLLQAIIRAIPAPVFYQNNEGVFLGCNEPFERLVGHPRERIVGKTAGDLCLGELLNEADVQFLRAERSRIYETEMKFADGSGYHVMFHQATFHKADGTIGGMIGVLLDISERKRVEREIEGQRTMLAQRVEERTAELSAANEVLADALRSKDEFLASMSHELRTPLNAVLGLAEALQEEVFGDLNAGQKKSLKTIEDSGRQLLDLITDILDVAQLGSGNLKLRLADTAVEPVCNASIRLVQQAAQRKNLTVTVSIDPLTTSLQADPRRLKQILVKLLGNAVKFTPDGGSIGLEVATDSQQQLLRFVVWDSGIGIAEEHLDKLFQPFVQLDSSLARQYEGSGLGLTLVYKMVEMHAGEIKVESAPGQGSRFIVTLPLRPPVETGSSASAGDAQAESTGRFAIADISRGAGLDRPAAAEEETNETARESSPPLILVAEDNDANASTVTQYLQAKGYRTVIAGDGAEAIDAARREPPDLILMDVQMPGMDGLEAIRRLRREERFATTPILVLTALALPGDRERCLAAGADGYLSKPVRLRQMAVKVANLLAETRCA